MRIALFNPVSKSVEPAWLMYEVENWDWDQSRSECTSAPVDQSLERALKLCRLIPDKSVEDWSQIYRWKAGSWEAGAVVLLLLFDAFTFGEKATLFSSSCFLIIFKEEKSNTVFFMLGGVWEAKSAAAWFVEKVPVVFTEKMGKESSAAAASDAELVHTSCLSFQRHVYPRLSTFPGGTQYIDAKEIYILLIQGKVCQS